MIWLIYLAIALIFLSTFIVRPEEKFEEWEVDGSTFS